MSLGEWAALSVAALLMVVAWIHRLRPVRGRAQVLFEFAAVQVVEHVQLNLFQVELQRWARRTQQAPTKPGLPQVHMWSCRAGERILRGVLMTPRKWLCSIRGWIWGWVHLRMLLERLCCCRVWKQMHVWVDTMWGGNVGWGARVGGHAGVGRLLVVQQVSEVAGQQEAWGAERRQSGGCICTLRLGALLQLLPPAGPVLVVGVVNGMLDPQTLGLLHVWTLLSQRHGLPGSSYGKRCK